MVFGMTAVAMTTNGFAVGMVMYGDLSMNSHSVVAVREQHGGATSEVIAISIAAGVVKSVAVMILTPFVKNIVGLDNPQSAMIFGGLMGTSSGTAAGLAAVDPKLVPYGAMTATFYTGLGCLLCPSILYLATKAIMG